MCISDLPNTFNENRMFTVVYLQFSSSYDKFFQALKKYSIFSCGINLILTSEYFCLKECVVSLDFIRTTVSKKYKQLVSQKILEE